MRESSGLLKSTCGWLPERCSSCSTKCQALLWQHVVRIKKIPTRAPGRRTSILKVVFTAPTNPMSLAVLLVAHVASTGGEVHGEGRSRSPFHSLSGLRWPWIQTTDFAYARSAGRPPSSQPSSFLSSWLASIAVLILSHDVPVLFNCTQKETTKSPTLHRRFVDCHFLSTNCR